MTVVFNAWVVVVARVENGKPEDDKDDHWEMSMLGVGVEWCRNYILM